MTDTGLPALPENEFWRVQRASVGPGFELAIMARVTTGIVFKRTEVLKVGHTVISRDPDPSSLSKNVIRRFAIKMVRERENYLRGFHLLGDYPPQSLDK